MSRRPCLIVAPRLNGRRFHVLVDLDANDRPLAVLIEAKKEGTHERESLRALSRIVTLALAGGASVAAIAAGLRGTEGGPEGVVEELDGVTWASSVPDMVGQILERLGELLAEAA